jgi:hypothetical protein
LSLVERADGERIQRIMPHGRFTAPDGLADRLPSNYAGWVRLERSFHRPTGLSNRSRVQLRINTNLTGQLAVNDRTLGATAIGENVFDITSLLQTRNRICLDLLIDASDAMRQPSCDARLEIFA